MKKSKVILIVAALASLVCNAELQAYRLERDTETEQLWLVGADYVRRECCIMSPYEYMMLTGNLFKVWTTLNAKEDGRRSLHGKRVTHEVTNGYDTVTYADGYVHTEKLVQKTAHNTAVFANRSHIPPAPVRKAMVISGTERYKAWKMKAEAAKTNGVKVVNVVHDAATGKDVEVK